jgi:uncharacterized protein YbgA (DUF1722 family)/uncharacterized protein YbbK (DUF523 family)
VSTKQASVIKIGISSCLLGRNVRFDGGHKEDRFLTGVLAAHVTWAPVCPEVEAGMGVPRESVHLVDDPSDPVGPRMLGTRSGTDHTEAMRAWARRRARELDALDLCGYVLKKDSPSCGMERVKLYPVGGAPASRDGIGLFARALIDHAPLLPVEEEGRLHDAKLRDNWVERVFAHRRLKDLRAARHSRGAVVAFHTAHKFQLLAHGTAPYQALGRLVARIAEHTPAEFLALYGEAFMQALRARATPARHVNVLQHIAGFFKRELSPGEKRELEEVIADYRAGLVPLVVPITLVRHHARAHGAKYVLDQTYLSPHPKELMLRNHV